MRVMSAPLGDSPISIEQNKKIAAEFAARFSANEMAGALEMISDDATWWVAGKPGHVPGAGQFTKDQVAGLFRRMAEQFPKGLQMTIKSMISEGEKVAVELEGYGELLNGRVYNNEYHMLLTIRDGKICGMREYHDTQHKVAIFFST
jgi:ketosteroid isomerase-like protein